MSSSPSARSPSSSFSSSSPFAASSSSTPMLPRIKSAQHLEENATRSPSNNRPTIEHGDSLPAPHAQAQAAENESVDGDMSFDGSTTTLTTTTSIGSSFRSGSTATTTTTFTAGGTRTRRKKKKKRGKMRPINFGFHTVMKALSPDRTHQKYLEKKRKKRHQLHQELRAKTAPLTPGRASTTRPATRGLPPGAKPANLPKKYPVELPSAGHNVLYHASVGGAVVANVAHVHQGVASEKRGKYSWILDVDKNANQPQMRNFFVAPSSAGFSAAQRRRMRLQTQQNLQLNAKIKEEVQQLCKERVELRTASPQRRASILNSRKPAAPSYARLKARLRRKLRVRTIVIKSIERFRRSAQKTLKVVKSLSAMAGLAGVNAPKVGDSSEPSVHASMASERESTTENNKQPRPPEESNNNEGEKGSHAEDRNHPDHTIPAGVHNLNEAGATLEAKGLDNEMKTHNQKLDGEKNGMENNKAGSDVAAANGSPLHDVMEAVEMDNTARLKELLDERPELVNTVDATLDEALFTPLHAAAAWGLIGCVRVILAYENVDVNAVSADGVSALLLAAHEGFTDVVVALLDTGNCDLSIAYPGGVTALHFAVANGHAAIAKALLLGEGCTPESDGGKFKPQTETQKLVRDKTGDTILHAAVRASHPEIAEIILQSAVGQDVINKPNRQGLTALALATQQGNLQAVQLLLGHRADPNQRADEESVMGGTAESAPSALQIARISQNEGIRKLLEESAAAMGQLKSDPNSVEADSSAVEKDATADNNVSELNTDDTPFSIEQVVAVAAEQSPTGETWAEEFMVDGATWHMFLDDESGMYYYCNESTGDTVWDDPRVGNEAYAAEYWAEYEAKEQAAAKAAQQEADQAAAMAMADQLPEAERLAVELMFKQVDADCNDSIDLGELRDLFELLGFPDEAERFAESYMQRFDLNGDNILEYLEFVPLYAVLRQDMSDKLTRYQQRHQIEASEARQKLVSRVKVAKDPEYFAKQEAAAKAQAAAKARARAAEAKKARRAKSENPIGSSTETGEATQPDAVVEVSQLNNVEEPSADESGHRNSRSGADVLVLDSDAREEPQKPAALVALDELNENKAALEAEQHITEDEETLIVACEDDLADEVDALLLKGINANCEDDQGYTPVMIAADQGSTNALEALLFPHEGVTAPPGDPTLVHKSHGVTAFFLALASKRWACVELILELQDTEKFDLSLTQQHHDTGNTFVCLPVACLLQHRCEP
eukprot:INCI5080.12.p1 GENE.INCI5080.12~~INCI5080.12.p1  ORF type:complete len:1239 (+),score=267.71 INCI5080.12:157-3873(+)